MRNFMIAAGLLLAFTGCGKKNKFDAAMDEMAGFKDKMCACKDGDKECGEKAHTDYREWRKGMKEKFTKEDQKNISDDQKKRGDEIMAEMEKCESRVRGSGGGMAPPAAGGGGSAMTPPPAAPPPAAPAGSAAP